MGKRDANQNAARIVHEATCREPNATGELEPAWAEWSRAIQATDARMMTLLRAAFEAGHDAGRRSFGIQGASKGGKARAASLSKRRRSEIAKRAAQKRWRR